MKVVSLYNLKGGVGKTAAAVNLSCLSADAGYKTLLVDLDSQGSSSFYLRIKSPKKLSAKKIIKGTGIRKFLRSTDYPNLDMLPSSLSYRKLSVKLDDVKHSRRRLQNTLEEVRRDYNLVFIDPPATIDLESENIFTASDIILIPFIPTTLSKVTYEKILAFFRNHELDASKIRVFFSMVDSRKKLHREMMEKMLEEDERFLNIGIPYASDVEKMGLTRRPVIESKPGSKASLAFFELWDELKRILYAL